MRNPSTLAFMLRWFPLQTVGGVVLAVWAAYTLLPYAPVLDQDGPVVAAVDVFGPTLYWFGLAFGTGLLGYAWWGASRLRNGA